MRRPDTPDAHPSKAEAIRQYLFDSFMAQDSGLPGYQSAVQIGRALGFTTKTVAAVLWSDELGFRPDWVDWDEDFEEDLEDRARAHWVTVYRISRDGIRQCVAVLTTKED